MAVPIRKFSSFIRGQVFRNKAYVGGRWVDSSSGRTFPVWNPSNKQLVADAPEMDQRDAEMAVEAANVAQKAWRSRSAKERSSLVYKWYEQVVKHSEELANIITTEQGKPLADAQAEVKYGASFLEWFAEEGRRIYGDIISPPTNDRRLLVVKQPVGVVVLVTPWNFPLAMATRKAGAALAAGCTAILKPSEETPFTALALAELAHRAGIPEGVFNVVTTSSECTSDFVKTLCTHPSVRKISFTGSTAVGKILMRHAVEDVKRLSLEMGGNAPLIVFDSANVKLAVAGTLAGKVRCSGQTCISPNRVLVQDQIHDQYVEEVSKAMSALKVGDGFDADVQIGPLINAQAVEKVESHVSDALKCGGEVVTGGQKATDVGVGYFYQPTLLTGVQQNMVLNQEETFGPVVPVARFTEEEEALHLANNTQHGLAGYIFSEDYRQIWRASEALECGIIGVNMGVPTSVETPFGGFKQSGIGSEGSKYGINEYINTKFIGMGDLKF